MKPSATYKDLFDPGHSTDFFEFERPVIFNPTSRYSTSNAAFCSELARVAYVREESRLVGYLSRVGMTLLARFDKNGTQAYLARLNSPRAAFLMFRGSEQVEDWAFNLRWLPAPWPHGRGGMVHRGFKEAFEQVRDAIEPQVCAIDYPLYIGGHSLGAALSVLAASLWNPTAVFTIAGPPVGNQAFVDSIDGVPVYEHVHGRDPVPGLLSNLTHAGDLSKLEEVKVGWSWKTLFKRPPPHLRAHIPLLYSCAFERLR